MKIGVYAIAKNEEKFVERFCDSIKDADHIRVGDTGSTDRTWDAFRDLGAWMVPVNIRPWRFDHARNYVLNSMPDDLDVCISLDVDEVLTPGWRDKLETLYRNTQFTRLSYVFNWGQGLTFHQHKMHSRFGYYWKFPCHEVLVKDPRHVERLAETSDTLIEHYPDLTKPRSHYLVALQAGHEESPSCPHMTFYLGREYMTAGNHWAAMGVLEQYLKMPQAHWKPERSYAMRLLGDCCVVMNEKLMAEEWYRKAINEAPEFREPWVAYGRYMLNQDRKVQALALYEQALKIKTRESVYLIEPWCWDGSVESTYKELVEWVTRNLRTTP